MIESKIKTLDELLPLRKKYRDEGKKVVFANGCFDILHVGHVRYLNAARRLGNILIVGLNSDESVRKVKGEQRPIISEEERSRIIASLQSVDHLFIFDDLTVDSVLNSLKPDVHAKGTDYTEMTVPERETVLSYGGVVAIAGDPKSHSTKDLIEHIQKTFKD